VLGGTRREVSRGLLAGLAVLLPVVAADILLGGTALFVAGYPIASFVAAGFALAPAIDVGVLAFVLAAVSPLWNHNGGSVDYWLRLGEIVLAVAFAVYLARRRIRAENLSRGLALLDEIGSTADGSLPLDETLRRAVEGIVPRAADFCMVDTIRDGVVSRVAVRVRGCPDAPRFEDGLRSRPPSTPEWLRDPSFGIPLVPYFVPRVTAGHEEIISHGPEDLVFLRSLGMRSFVIAPMIARGRMLGTLTIGVAWSGRRYDDDDLAFTRALASRLGLALDHAGLFSDLESVERRMDAVMSKIPEAVVVHDAGGGVVYANDVMAKWVGRESGQELIRLGPRALRPEVDVFTEDGVLLPDVDMVAERLATGRLPFRQLVRVVTRFNRQERWVMLNSEGISGPEGRLLYAVTTLEDVTETKRAELGQRLLARTGELLSGSQDFRGTVRAVAEIAVPGFAEWCTVKLISGDGMVEQSAIAHADPSTGEVTVELRDVHPVSLEAGNILGPVLAGEGAQLRIVSERDLRGIAGEDEHLQVLPEGTSGEAIVAPVRAGERLLGALLCVNGPGRAPWQEGDVPLAAELGARAGIAVENARLAEMRREIAESLQHGLRPPEVPRIEGWEVATMYHPAGELNEVGGDFYDAFEVENGWMVVVGDVVGRGARAAALTALTRHTIHTACRLSGDPRQALSILNDRLRAREDQPLCSVAIVVLSAPADGGADAVAVSAGHPLPLIVRGDSVEEACQPGPMLGTMAEADWTLNLVTVEPGDQLFVYTDGVTDARAGMEFFGEERLRSRLAGVRDPVEAVARIEGALTDFVGGPMTDDAAAVAIMRSPGSTPSGDGTAAEAAPGPDSRRGTGGSHQPHERVRPDARGASAT
jgi:PAS domain S-box-containing protein